MPDTPIQPERLPTREYVGYALGDTASNLFFQTFGIFLTYFYTDVWGIDASLIGKMFLRVRLLDASVDPFIGMMADRTKTKWGKFRPYLLWFAVPYGVAGYLLFASPNFGLTGKLAYAYATYAFMMIAYSFINVPYSSLLGVISPSPRIRTLASSYRFVGAFGGGLLITLLVRPLVKLIGGGSDPVTGRVLHELKGFQLTMLIFAVASVAMFLICFLLTKERVTPPPGQKQNAANDLSDLVRNFPWVMLLFATIFSLTFIGLRSGSTIYYFKYVAKYGTEAWVGGLDRVTVFLSSGMLCQMLGAFGLSFIARLADKRLVAVVLTLISGACWAAFYFIPTNNFALQLAVNGLGNFCLGPTSALVWAMYADVADYGEWKFGRRSTGLVYSASLFALKTGTALAGWMVPKILDHYGYVPNVVQTASSLLGITLMFSLFPGAFAGLKALSLWIYPLSKPKVDQMEEEIKERRAGAARAPTPA